MSNLLSPSYCNLFEDLTLERGDRYFLIDSKGAKYFDLFANFGCTNAGHHPKIVEAIRDQAKKLLMIMTSDLINPLAIQLAKDLIRVSELGEFSKVYFGNSGAEANEAAIKSAHYNKSGFGISFINAFHGRTLGILPHSSSKSIHRKGFQIHHPLLVPNFGSMASIDWIEDVIFKKIADPSEISYLITEPIQIEGGVIVPEPDFLPRLKKLCELNQIQFILDEVQTGFKRTGPMFCYQNFNFQPDFLTLGKAIASGLPLSAVISPQMNWVEGSQGSTFGGSVIACAAGIEMLKILEEIDIKPLEKVIDSNLREIEDIVEVSGMGAIWGIKFPNFRLAEEVRLSLYHKRILVIPCGESSIRIEPPLTFDPEELDQVMGTVTSTICGVLK